MTLYPLKLIPYFRHGDATPWGGEALRDLFGKSIPDETTGESLEVSALDGMQSVIQNGELAGQPLSRAADAWGKALTGQGEAGFPLMVKLLDAKETLSVQVHPGDVYAAENEGKRGKTEAWVVLSAPSDAKLVYGVNTQGRALPDIVAEGKLEAALNWVSVRPGDVLYIPHGMVHALSGSASGDLVIYEIQQSSDVTYRFWDWGRVDAQGNPRALHTQKALDVTRADLHMDKLSGATMIVKGGSVTAYICGAHFELLRLNVAGDMPLTAGRMRLITTLGACRLTWLDGAIDLAPGDTVLVPAGLSRAVLSGQLSALCATTPDQAALKAALGYRASAVAGLMECEGSNT